MKNRVMDVQPEILEELRKIRYELEQLREDTGGINKKFAELPLLLVVLFVTLGLFGVFRG